jgi:adenylylsulfate kinase
MYKETKKRTLIKTISWRFVAVLNSFLVLTFSVTNNNFLNAVYMNITGFGIYYLFERVWNKIKYGKEKI